MCTHRTTWCPHTIHMRRPLGRQPCRVCVEATDLITIISEEFPRSAHYHNARERRDMFTSHTTIGSKGRDKGSAWLDVKMNNSFASHPVVSDRSDERYTYSWDAYYHVWEPPIFFQYWIFISWNTLNPEVTDPTRLSAWQPPHAVSGTSADDLCAQ